MVGVAGKSKGCHTCRKRKVHCDGDRPSCARCTKGNRVCGGYERQRLFKNLSALDRDTLLTRTQPLASLTDLQTIKTASAEDLTRCTIPETDDSATSNRQELQGKKHAFTLSDLFDAFLDHYIPREEEAAELQNREHKVQVSWLQAIDPSQANDASLDLAILALSLVSLGRKHGDERLRREGTANYGKALNRLHDILSHHSLLLEEQTLASCMALSTFELLEAPGENTGGWVSHVEGIARLIQLRGPESHIEASSHQLFLGFRSTGITYALATRTPTYLAQPDWLTVPWTIQPKSDIDQLFDIMTQIATLLAKTAQFNIPNACDIPYSQSTELLQQSWEFQSQLKTWYQGFLCKQTGPLYHEQPSSTHFLPHLPTVFSTSLHFPTFEIARLHVSYWTILLLLHDSILTMPLSAEHDDVTPPSRLLTSVQRDFTQTQALQLATLIAQSMEYLLSEDMQILGPQKVFFTLRSAMHVFETSTDHEKEAQWCSGVFDELDRRGYPFGRILCRCRWEEIPALLAGKI